MKNRVIVTNIQRMCMQDGPGIRTTVFLKGCNLHCPWCANPENICMQPEKYRISDMEQGIYGREYDSQSLQKEIMRDRRFWEDGGGVTFSGGEPLLQLDLLEPLLRNMKKERVHVAIETALQVPMDKLFAVIDYVDLFIVDIKILDKSLCKKVLGGDLDYYYDNLKLLEERGKQILFRIPCNKEYTVTPENCSRIDELLTIYPHCPVEIFATHSLGRRKYESLGKTCIDFLPVDLEELQLLKRRFSTHGNSVVINTI